ncbi:hypothetical protein WISP_111503 [Willisornis vidua]|uniref:Uncharacterized protein n=1 Tax=Willisornis vidua TaxID=1566151 RepID=A0ABQ9CYA0_9PASS|nr:hypothetical protein WISP_111503 [Willisornis vidua]
MELLERPEEAPGWAEDGAALLGGKAGRAGIVQPGKEKLWGDLIVAFQDLEESTRKMERDYLEGPGVTGQGGMASNFFSILDVSSPCSIIHISHLEEDMTDA